jgi:hypothetical protein
LFDQQRATRDLLDAQQHAISVLRCQRHRFQDQQVEGAG